MLQDHGLKMLKPTDCARFDVYCCLQGQLCGLCLWFCLQGQLCGLCLWFLTEMENEIDSANQNYAAKMTLQKWT